SLPRVRRSAERGVGYLPDERRGGVAGLRQSTRGDARSRQRAMGGKPRGDGYADYGVHLVPGLRVADRLVRAVRRARGMVFRRGRGGRSATLLGPASRRHHRGGTLMDVRSLLERLWQDYAALNPQA